MIELTQDKIGAIKGNQKVVNVNSTKEKIVPYEKLSEIRKSTNSRIVHCHGVFDVLHAGHLAYFESARKFGDVLVVTITADQFVNKGPGRPYFTGVIRARMLAALQSVDYVAINPHQEAVPAIELLKPDFYVKGPDYKDLSKDITGGIYREKSAVESCGGKIVFTEDETMSSSSLINKFFSQWNEDQTKMIESIHALGGMERIEECLHKISKERVRIVGEPIVDTYVFCGPESISSKNPCISAKYLYEENYTGGSLAIANHLAGFCNEVELVFTHGGEEYFQNLLKERMDKKVKLTGLELKNIPTPRKTRYIAVDLSQRLFELTDLRHDQWKQHSPKEFVETLLKPGYEKDTTIVADFGHGIFENSVLNAMADLKGFVSLNVQTNSSNLGFNPFTKHKKFSYLCIDTKEARIAYHDRYNSAVDLARKIRSDLPREVGVSITLGPNGSYFFPMNETGEVSSPAFTDKVIDATGAGDAYFAMTSLLVKTGAPAEFVPFIGNVFAGLKTKIVGNKSAVSVAQLTKALGSILK